MCTMGPQQLKTMKSRPQQLYDLEEGRFVMHESNHKSVLFLENLLKLVSALELLI